MSVRANFVDIYLRGIRGRSLRSGTESEFHCRLYLTVFFRSIYLINLDQYSPAMLSLRRSKNNLYYHMTRTAPRAISLENHKRKGPV